MNLVKVDVPLGMLLAVRNIFIFGILWSFLWSTLAFSQEAPQDAQDDHWAFEALGPARVGQGIDAFIEKDLDEKGLKPNPEADRRVLLRRLSLTLTGLPPTPAEMTDWLKEESDEGEDAWSRQVERLLASPAYGERWARMWLDVARYADSNGQDENKAMAHAWRYRDWVIDAFNRDLPFQDFVRHQIAGDLVEGLDEAARTEAITATGFLCIGPKILAEQDKEKMIHDIVDEQMDTMGRAFLGLTLGCARCHDHFFDPFSQEEYFALAGIFQSTRTMADTAFVSKWLERDVSSAKRKAEIAAHERKTKTNASALNRLAHAENDRLRARLAADIGVYAKGGGAIPEINQRWAKEGKQEPLKSKPKNEATFTLLRELSIEKLGAQRGDLVRGKSGGAHSGASGPFDVSHRPELDPAVFTLEAWVRFNRWPGGSDDRRWIVNKNQNEWEKGHFALVLNDKALGAYVAPEGGQSRQIHVNGGKAGKLKVKTWHHVACSYDGRQLRIVLDGREVGASQPADRPRQTAPGASGATGHLRIAGRADGYSGGREMDVDEVRLYERVLSIGELKQRMNHPDGPALPGQVGRWAFDPTTEAARRALENAELAAQAKRLLELPNDPSKWWSAEGKARKSQLESEKKTLKATAPKRVMVMAVEEGTITESQVHARGNHMRARGEPVPRGFPSAVAPEVDVSINGTGSGRRELADWILHPKHPLAARVYVNRIWQAHFGEGLVRSPDNFGRKGESPSHPELLDWLAREFLRSGSTKQLHRLIVNSSAWRRSSVVGAEAMETDPDNRLLWRMPMRRKTVEEIRDSLLAVSGRLDRTMGGPVMPDSFKNHDYVSKTLEIKSLRRSIYMPVIRDRVDEVFTLFDFPEPSASTSKRDVSEVPLQALFFMNSSFVKDCAEGLAKDVDDVGEAIERVLLREATEDELARGETWLTSGGTMAEFCQMLFSTNEFLYVD